MFRDVKWKNVYLTQWVFLADFERFHILGFFRIFGQLFFLVRDPQWVTAETTVLNYSTLVFSTYNLKIEGRYTSTDTFPKKHYYR